MEGKSMHSREAAESGKIRKAGETAGTEKSVCTLKTEY